MKVPETRHFHIVDIDCDIKVEYETRKNLLDRIDEYICNLQETEFFDPTDASFTVLYEDGTTDYIDLDYDGHKIRRQHIVSIVNTNPESNIVYGNFSMNEYGCVTVSEVEEISDYNIIEKIQKSS